VVERVEPSDALTRVQQLTSRYDDDDDDTTMTELPSIECRHLIVGHARYLCKKTVQFIYSVRVTSWL